MTANRAAEIRTSAIVVKCTTAPDGASGIRGSECTSKLQPCPLQMKQWAVTSQSLPELEMQPRVVESSVMWTYSNYELFFPTKMNRPLLTHSSGEYSIRCPRDRLGTFLAPRSAPGRTMYWLCCRTGGRTAESRGIANRDDSYQ